MVQKMHRVVNSGHLWRINPSSSGLSVMKAKERAQGRETGTVRYPPLSSKGKAEVPTAVPRYPRGTGFRNPADIQICHC